MIGETHMKLNEIEIIQLIEKLQKGEGTDSQQEEWMNEIFQSVPFAGKIYQLLFWSDETFSPAELFQKAKNEHKPIIL